MAKVIVYLRDYEKDALSNLAEHKYRTIKAQAALIIRKELERLQLIPSKLTQEPLGQEEELNEHV
jgi:hypothetical protein